MKTQHLIFIITLFISNTILASPKIALSGLVSDSISGEAISAANIVVENKETGTISNFSGSYMLYLDEGQYKITYTHKGYLKKEIDVNLKKSQELNIELVPEENDLDNFLMKFIKRDNADKLITKK